MESSLILISRIINLLHDLILLQVKRSGTPITDKELHFWIFGLIGMLIFFVSHAAFSYLRKWGEAAISFVFTGFVLTILAVGIEIEQNITGRGNMETVDVLAAISGFLTFFLVYWAAVKLGALVLRGIRCIGHREKDEDCG
mgnify:CR=1 FL=1